VSERGPREPTAAEEDRPTALGPCRCVLFVPGSRPDRYSKALASGADRVCVDLEDAVAPGDKAAARTHVLELMRGQAWDPRRTLVRINHPSTPEGASDLAALAEAPAGTAVLVMVPKCGSPGDLDAVRSALPAAGGRLVLVPVVESAAGLARVEEIATAPSVGALLLGGVDLTAELGAALEWDSLLYARGRLVHAAALAGVRAIDVPFLDASDAAGLRDEAARVRRLGFGGKAAIHPHQVGVVQAAFSPSDEEIARAARVLEVAGRQEGAFLLDGRMVDRPVVEAARRIVAMAEADAASTFEPDRTRSR